MPFATPLALLGLLFLPLVVAFYLLKLRRDETIVPSTLLWRRLVDDVEANAPWQRLRRSLLLLLQLLLVLALALLAARPFFERPAGLARDLVVVVDVSASMAATDVSPSRLAAAKDEVLGTLGDLPTDGRVSVIAAGRTARVVANGTADLARVRAAVQGLTVEPAAGDLADALRLASALASRSGDGQVLLATDAAGSVPTVRVDAPVRVLQVGRARRNQAIAALAVRTSPSAVTRSLFVSVTNADLQPAKVRLELLGDGRLLEARDVFLDPVARADVSIDDVPRSVAVIEVRLVGVDPAGPDQLALDDRAWAIVPSDRLHRILLVTAGDPYLEAALLQLPDAEVYGVKPADYGASTHPESFDLVVFDATLPAALPDRPILAVAPPASGPLGEVLGTVDGPGIGTLDPQEPLLRYVDLSTVHIAQAQKLVLPAWARMVIPGPGGVPLLYAGRRNGLPTAVLAFEPRRSDLPLQVAFPILVSNLAGELLGASAAPAAAVAPGAPLTLPLPEGATGLRVTRPDGSVVEVSAATTSRSVVFSGTDGLGVYTAVPVGAKVSPGVSPGASPGVSPSASSAAATAPAAASPFGSTAGVTAPPVDPNAPLRFAVDLFEPAESDIAPGDAAALTALGTGASTAATSSVGSSPGASAPIGAAPVAPRPPARDELWAPLLLLVLLLLLVEWTVYERDALIRLRRRLAAALVGRRLIPRLPAGRRGP